LYYSTQGTGEWTICGNGTISAGSHVGYAVLDNTLIVCDGAGSTRHTTSGTSFTNTTLAPVAVDLAQYQNRIYAAGTASTLFYSTTNDATNWNTSGTSDSSSFQIPGSGKLNKIFKANDRLMASKTSGIIYKWDGYSLVDTGTTLGPASPYSVDQVDGYYLWLNRLGVNGYGGVRPEVISNTVQPYIYNNMGSGVVGSNFSTAAGAVHRYDYYVTLGTVTEDVFNYTVDDAILKYNFQKNEFLFYKFANVPTAYHSFKDADGVQQLVFGDASGQCYKFNSGNSDNGVPIPASCMIFSDQGRPDDEKEYNWLSLFFNPGCCANCQVAISESFRTAGLKWVEIGDMSDGQVDYRFPSGSRGNYLFIRFYETSTTVPFTFYGMAVDYDVVEQ
jgi:hypothetical protein